MKQLWLLLLLLAAAAACSLFGPVVCQTTYQFGVGIRDVTPTALMIDNREVWLGGFGFGRTRGWPTGVHDPIMARAFCVSDGNTTMVFSVSDVTGTSNRVLNAIRDGVQANTGVPRTHIHIASTHTHAGPDLQGLWNGASDNYKEMYVAGMVDAMTEACVTRRLSFLFVSEINGTQFASNRRGHGWTNSMITVLEGIDVYTGETIGTVVNFAAHPTTTGSSNREFSGDWIWYTNEYMEASTNSAPSMFFNGPQGDVGGASGCVGNDVWERAEYCGSGIADLGVQSMSSQIQVTGPLFCQTHYWTHPVTNVGFILAYAIGMLDYDVVPINETGSFSFDTQASYWRIGNTIDGISFPGESLTRNAYPILETMTAPYKLFFGLTGDTLGYFVPSDEWNIITGYEEKVSIEKFVGDTTRDILINLISNAPAKQ